MYECDQSGPFALLTPKLLSSDMAQQNESTSLLWREHAGHQHITPSGLLTTAVELFCS